MRRTRADEAGAGEGSDMAEYSLRQGDPGPERDSGEGALGVHSSMYEHCANVYEFICTCDRHKQVKRKLSKISNCKIFPVIH